MNVVRAERTDNLGERVDAIKVNLLIPGLKKAFDAVPFIHLLESDPNNLLIYFFQNVFGYEGVPRLHFYYPDPESDGLYRPINLSRSMVEIVVAGISHQDMVDLCRYGAENCCEMWRGVIERSTPEHLASSARSVTGLSPFTHGDNYALQLAVANVLLVEAFAGNVSPVINSVDYGQRYV